MKILVEKLDSQFIEIWKETSKILLEIKHLNQISQKLIDSGGKHYEEFWTETKKKYKLELSTSENSHYLDDKTWQIFEVNAEKKTKVQIVGRISNDLISQWEKLKEINTQIVEHFAKIFNLITAYKEMKKDFWEKLERYYNLHEKHLYINEANWSICQDTTQEDFENFLTQMTFKKALAEFTPLEKILKEKEIEIN